MNLRVFLFNKTGDFGWLLCNEIGEKARNFWRIGQVFFFPFPMIEWLLPFAP